MTDQQPSPDHILRIGMGFEASKTLLSAVEVGLFTELARKPADAATLQQALGLHPRSARDFFDTLVALGFLERSEGVYENTPATAAYLDRNKPSYGHLGSLLEMANARLYGFWGSLTEALLTGKPQNESKAGDLPLYEAIYADQDRLEQFLASMTGISHSANVKIAELFPWQDYNTFADLGTAQGDLAAQIALAHPHLTGVGLDLAPVGPVFDDYMKHNGLVGRLSFQSGDFFSDSPFPEAEVIALGHVLHNWNLEQKKLLIQKSYDALPDGGALIVYDAVIDDDRSQNAFGLLMSLNMLTATEGGFTYTAADCTGWMAEAGFNETRVAHLTGPDSMVVGIK